MHPHTIFFDLYQTLVDIDIVHGKEHEARAYAEALIPALVERGVAPDEAAKLQARVVEETGAFYAVHDRETEHHRLPDVFDAVLRTHYGLALPADELVRLLHGYRKISRGHLRLYPGVAETLESLARDHELVLASYTQSAYSDLELEELGIRRHFTRRIYSSDLGVRKSSPSFYPRCLEAVGREAADCVMVGDSAFLDVEMPQRSGMRAIRIVNPLTELTDVESRGSTSTPDATVPLAEFTRLPETVEAIFGTTG